MVAIIKVAGVLIGAAASFASAAALPAAAPEAVPEPLIIPGAGMPSLQDLGISEEAFKQKRDEVLAEFKAREASSSLQTRATSQMCWGVGANSRCSSSDGAALVTYLRNLGTQRCTVSNQIVEFARTPSGSCRVMGQNRSANPQASSYCVDVATGLDWVLNNCQNENTVGGENAANANGDLVGMISTFL